MPTQNWQALGGGGHAVLYDLIKSLEKSDFLQETKNKNEEDEDAFEGYGGDGKDDSVEVAEASLTTVNNSAEIILTGLEVDTSGMELAEPGQLSQPSAEDGFQQFLRVDDYNNFVKAETDEGDPGTGATPEEIRKIVTNSNDLQEKIKELFPSDLSLYAPIFSLDGGTGNGYFREIISHMEDGGFLYDSGKIPDTTVPIGISPHKQAALRSTKKDRDAAGNIMNCLDEVDPLIGHAINSFVVVDNDAAAFNAACRKEDYTLGEVKSIKDPIFNDRDYEKFQDTQKTSGITTKAANEAIVAALLPIQASLMNRAGGMKFGKGTKGMEQNDFIANYGGSYCVPSYMEVPTLSVIQDLFDGFISQDGEFDQKVSHLALYTFLTSIAPIHADDVSQIDVYIWNNSHQNVDQNTQNAVSEKLSKLNAAQSNNKDDFQIKVEQVYGIEDRSDMKIWTLTALDEISETLKQKFEE